MKRLNFKYLVLSVLAVSLAIHSTAQQDFILDSENSELLISGTSSIHDWEMEAQTFNGKTTLELNDKEVKGIRTIDFSVKVADIESGKRIMDNKAHDALNEKQNPRIRFLLNSNDLVAISNNKAKFAGILEVAGKSRDVEVACDFNLVNNTTLSVQGKAPLKMTDFGIDPPTAMLGTLQTGDEISVKFDLLFNVSQDQLSEIQTNK